MCGGDFCSGNIGIKFYSMCTMKVANVYINFTTSHATSHNLERSLDVVNERLGEGAP